MNDDKDWIFFHNYVNYSKITVDYSHQEETSTAVRKQYQKLVEFIRNGKLHSVSTIELSTIEHAFCCMNVVTT